MALRPAARGDRAFLLAVYAGTRADELALLDWSEAERRAFVEMQFAAQDAYYRDKYPAASFDVVVAGGRPAGRLYVDRRPGLIHVIDIALLPEHRDRGLGSRLLQAVIDEADAGGRKVTIYVERFNPALRLYRRLGFVPAGDQGVHLLLERKPYQGPAGGSAEDRLVPHALPVGAEGDEEEGELAQVGVAHREGLLGEGGAFPGVEQQREGDTAGSGGLAAARTVTGLLAGGEDEVDRRPPGRRGLERLPHQRGEGGAGEVFEHGGHDRPPGDRPAIITGAGEGRER